MKLIKSLRKIIRALTVRSYKFRVIDGYYYQLDDNTEMNYFVNEEGKFEFYSPTGVIDVDYQVYGDTMFLDCYDRFKNPPDSKFEINDMRIKIQPFRVGEILIIDSDSCIEIGYWGRKSWKHCCSWKDFDSIKDAEKYSWKVANKE